MAEKPFNWSGILIRFVFALLLVFATYNPTEFSYYHWGIASAHPITAAKAFVGIVLIIGWAIYLRATFHSLGFIGLTLTLAFFGTLVWLIVDYGLVPINNYTALTYIALVVISWILTTGMSWSFIRKRMSGQYDVMEHEENQ